MSNPDNQPNPEDILIENRPLSTILEEIATGVKNNSNRLENLENRFDHLENQFNHLEDRFNHLDNQVKILGDNLERFTDRFSDYQQATQWVVQLAFSLIVVATVSIIVTGVFAK